MNRFVNVAGVLALGLAWNSMAVCQETPQYIRIQCVKARDGKGAELSSFLQESTKVSRLRVESGEFSFAVLAQAAYPAGRSARCDYHLVAGFNGFPPESSPATDADLKKAGVAMDLATYFAKRDDSSYLVSTELWLSRGGVGNVQKGGYVRVNYDKVKPGMGAEWLKWETTGWKQLAEAAAIEMPGTSWGVYTLSMPGGSAQPSNAMTVDGFPSWGALGKGLPVQALWSKAHPDLDYTQHMGKMTTLIDRPRVEVYKVLEAIRK